MPNMPIYVVNILHIIIQNFGFVLVKLSFATFLHYEIRTFDEFVTKG